MGKHGILERSRRRDARRSLIVALWISTFRACLRSRLTSLLRMVESDAERLFLPFDERGDIDQSVNHLPHWEQDRRAYFVTIRLADSLPLELLAQWQTEQADWKAQHPEPWTVEEDAEYHARFSSRIEIALDRSYGACVLRQPEIADCVGNALMFFEGQRYHQFAWVVMPNHVHVLFTPLGGLALADLLHSWKSFTAKAANRMLNTTGSFWQKDYFDRLIRGGAHFGNCVRYIRNNPKRAGLRGGEFLLWESDLAKTVR